MSKIYKIVDNENNVLFVGGTKSKYLSSVYNQLKLSVAKQNRKANKELHEKIKEIGIENIKLLLVEQLEATDRDAIKTETFKYRDELNPLY